MSDITEKGGNRTTHLVMECHPSYAIVLNNEDRTIKAANMGYQEGQVVREIAARQIPKAPILFRPAPLATAAYLCLAVLGGGAYDTYGISYGTAETRISSDVGMSVSYMDCIVDLGDMSEDGKEFTDQVSYRGRNSKYMIGVLVGRAMEVRYLTEGGAIYVVISSGSERWKTKRTDVICTELDTLLKGGMSVEIHVENIGKDGPPAAAPHHKDEIPGGTGGDKPTSIGVPPGGTGEDAGGNGRDDRDGDERGDDTENDDEGNDAGPDRYDEDDGDDREEDVSKDKTGDKDDGRDDDGRDDADDGGDDIRKTRGKPGRDNVVRQSSGVGDNKGLDDLNGKDNGEAGNGLNDNRDRGENDGGEHSGQDGSDEGGSDEDDVDENDSQEEDNDGHENGEDDKNEGEDDDD